MRGDSSLGYQFLLAWLWNLTQYFVRYKKRKTKLRPEAVNNSSNCVSCRNAICFLLLRIPFVCCMKLKLLQGYKTRKLGDLHCDWRWPHIATSVNSFKQSSLLIQMLLILTMRCPKTYLTWNISYNRASLAWPHTMYESSVHVVVHSPPWAGGGGGRLYVSYMQTYVAVNRHVFRWWTVCQKSRWPSLWLQPILKFSWRLWGRAWLGGKCSLRSDVKSVIS